MQEDGLQVDARFTRAHGMGISQVTTGHLCKRVRLNIARLARFPPTEEQPSLCRQATFVWREGINLHSMYPVVASNLFTVKRHNVSRQGNVGPRCSKHSPFIGPCFANWVISKPASRRPCKPVLVVPAAWCLANVRVLGRESGSAEAHQKSGVEIWISQLR